MTIHGKEYFCSDSENDRLFVLQRTTFFVINMVRHCVTSFAHPPKDPSKPFTFFLFDDATSCGSSFSAELMRDAHLDCTRAIYNIDHFKCPMKRSEKLLYCIAACLVLYFVLLLIKKMPKKKRRQVPAFLFVISVIYLYLCCPDRDDLKNWRYRSSQRRYDSSSSEVASRVALKPFFHPLREAKRIDVPNFMKRNPVRGSFWGAGAENDNEQYTVLINTFDRDSLLKRIVSHYKDAPRAHKVIVIWNDIAREVPEEFKLWEGNPRSKVQLSKGGKSLNNRYLPRKGIETDAIFHVDDDVLVPIDHVEFAFEVWLQFQHSMIGFSPWGRSVSNHRTFSLCNDKKMSHNSLQYSILCTTDKKVMDHYYWDGSPYLKFEMVLNNAIFLHRHYLEVYSSDIDDISAVRNMVDETRNCEDIAMSLIHMRDSKLPPLMIDTYDIASGTTVIQNLETVNEKGHHPGLNRLQGHYKTRSKCINEMSTLLGNFDFSKYSSNFKLAPIEPTEII